MEAEPQAYNALAAAESSEAAPLCGMPGVGHLLLSEVTALSYLLVFGPVQSLPDLVLAKGSRFKAFLADMVYTAKLKRCTYTQFSYNSEKKHSNHLSEAAESTIAEAGSGFTHRAQDHCLPSVFLIFV